MNLPKKSREQVGKSDRGTRENPIVKWLLILIAMAFAMVFLLLPIVNVFAQAFSNGFKAYAAALAHPDTMHAIQLTLTIAAITVPANLIFGVAASWCIAKFDFRWKPMLLTFIDLPFSVSPVVAGLMFVLLFGAEGLLGPWLQAHDIKIIFALPGMVLATIFVTFPFVARELIPIMQSTGSAQEQAAMTLGASGWKTFWHVSLPSIKWGLLYGIILCNARAMGEFGAVYVVSSRINSESETVPLRVERLYQEFDPAAPFAVATLLAFLALITLGLKTWLEWRAELHHEAAQRATQLPLPGNGSDDTQRFARKHA
jgi:sulfate/thiosulfate transport system permease protein